LERRGVHAEGRVGDADPLLAIADALPTFPADEFVIAAEPERADALIRRAHDRFAPGMNAAASVSLLVHDRSTTRKGTAMSERRSIQRIEQVSTPCRELAQRLSGAVEVLLLWHPDADRLELSVEDTTTRAGFHIEVAPADALDAFHHPFAYAARDDNSVRVLPTEMSIVDG